MASRPPSSGQTLRPRTTRSSRATTTTRCSSAHTARTRPPASVRASMTSLPPLTCCSRQHLPLPRMWQGVWAGQRHAAAGGPARPQANARPQHGSHAHRRGRPAQAHHAADSATGVLCMGCGPMADACRSSTRCSRLWWARSMPRRPSAWPCTTTTSAWPPISAKSACSRIDSALPHSAQAAPRPCV